MVSYPKVNMSIFEYKSNADLAAVELFKDYPKFLLQFAYAACVIFMLIGIPGNLITIIALASYKKLRNATAIFIINLQISHLIFCCMVLPISAATFLSRHWIFGKTMCGVYPLLKFGLNGTAHFTVAAITINRYLIVCHPHFYPKLYKKKILVISLISTWVGGFLLFVPAIFGLWGRFGLDEIGGSCTMLQDKNNNCPKIIIISVAFTGPYLFIVICYSCIWSTVRKMAKKRKNHKSKSTKPDMSDNDLESSVVEMETVCPDPSMGDSSLDYDTNKHNIPTTVTPNGRNSSIVNFFNQSIRRITKKEERQHMPSRKDKKLATMIVAIIVSFTVCHLPIMLTRVIYGNYKSKPLLNVLAHLLDYSSAFISPIIYVIMSSEYRQAYTSLFKDGKSKIMKYFKL